MAVELVGERESHWAPGRSNLRQYRAEGGRHLFVLRQTGAFPDLCHDHGRLLADEVEEGIFPEILDTIEDDTTPASDTLSTIPAALFFRITQDLERAASGEFVAGVRRLHEGYAAGLAERGRRPRYTLEQVRQACYAIDAGNVSTGILRRLERWAAPGGWPGEILDYLRGALRAYPHADPDLVARSNLGLILALLRRAVFGRPAMGCTGFAVPPGEAADGRGLHARTFDGAFFAWNERPVLALVDERGTTPGARHRYAAVGTAGLVYPGGISGLNDAGLACSLHQMSTTTYSTGGSDGRHDIAPFVQQRILREASNLGDAIRICAETRHFASWAILVSDAANGQSVSIEINGREGVQRVRTLGPDPRRVQTNHFRHPEMAERFDHFGDAHFTKSVGKWMETRGRLATVEARLDLLAGQIDTGAALTLLASHDDHWLGGARRAFGRTVCKAYGIMASVARVDPDRARARDELWLTLGDADGRPGPHARMVGVAIDWEAMDARPLPETHEARSVPEGYRDALAAYVRAFRTVARPRTRAGYLPGRPDEGTMAGLRAEAIGALDRAAALAEATPGADVEVAVRYVRARLRHEHGQLTEAERDWADLLRLATLREPPVPLHPYDRALIFTFAAATALARGEAGTGAARLSDAVAWRRRAAEALPGTGGEHPGFAELATLQDALTRAPGTELPPIDWVTVE